MKKNLLWSVILLMAGAIAWSCSNDPKEEGPDTRGVTEMNIRLGNVETRAASAPVTDVTVNFNTGLIVFADANGLIHKKVDIITGNATGPNAMDTEVGIADLTDVAGATLKEVPKASTVVYIYGNIPTGVDLTSATTIAQINALKVNIATQMNMSGATPTYGKEGVMVYGSGIIDYTPEPATATVRVKPIVARIELNKLELTTGHTIQSFGIKGIFITKSYSNAAPDGTGAAGDFMDFGPSNSTRTIYLPNETGVEYNNNPGLYPQEYKHVWYDYADTGIGTYDATNEDYNPATGTIWAYHVFAPAATDPSPWMVLRVRPLVKQNNHDYTIDKFITITGFNDGAASPQTVPVEAGKIYRITALQFSDGGTEGSGTQNKNEEEDDGDIKVIGAGENVDIVVKVEIINWEIVTVIPNLQ